MVLAPSLAILGLGNMGEAIMRGLVGAGATPPMRIIGFDPNAECRRALSDVPQLTFAESVGAAAREADVLLLAVKPQAMAGLLDDLREVVTGKLVVSIAAGVTMDFIESRLVGARVVRTMPNTPMLVGRGVVAVCPGRTADVNDVASAKSLFPGATLIDVPEDLMDAATAISGSGPAYFFAFVEALAAAAEAEGFDRATAYALAAGTFTGAAALLEQSSTDAADLRRRVTSPAGTTAAALEVFDERGLAGIVQAAVSAATQRARELSHAAWHQDDH